MDKRTKVIGVRVTEDQHEIIARMAASVGLTISEFTRSLMLGKTNELLSILKRQAITLEQLKQDVEELQELHKLLEE